MNDLKYALRQLLKNPGFTAVAVLTLAICLGGSLAIFAVVDAVLVRALPFPDDERLVVIQNSYPGAGIERGNASVANYFERRRAIEALESVSLFTEVPYIVGEAGSSRRVTTARVTPEFFRTLGVPLAMGREFTDEELDFETHKVAIITDQFWRSYFNRVPDVLGRTFVMQTFSVTVVGVLPPGFRYLSSRAQIFRPFAHYRHRRERESRHSNDGQMIARLGPNRSLAEAQAQLDALNERQLSDDPARQAIQDTGYRARVSPLHQDHVRAAKPILLLLQAGVLCLLLIGVVNIASLWLIRASGRARELAIRQALGANRRQVAVTIIVETVLLALAGGTLGVCFAAVGIQLSDRLGLDALPLGDQIALNGRTALLSMLSSIGVGIAIAFPILWNQIGGSTDFRLKNDSRAGTADRRAQHLRHGFVVAQIALAFVLLCGAASLGLSLKRILDKSPGFSAERVLSAELILPWEHYPTNPSRVAFVRRLQDRLRALPGITHAAVSSGLPFTSDGSLAKTIFPEGFVPAPGNSLRSHYFSSVTPDYWRAMNIPLLQGRLIEESDVVDRPRVAVIDEALARQHWPEGNALGHRFSTTPYDLFDRKLFGDMESKFEKEAAYTVVGIVGNVNQSDLAEGGKRGTVYLPYTDSLKFQLVLRTTTSASIMAPIVEKLVRQLDSGLPLTDFRTMQARVDDSLVARRSPAILVGIFAAVALLLASLGTYGVLAYAVSLRQREIGVRMALGAQPFQVLAQFLGIGTKLCLVGLALGTIGTWATGRAMQSLLFDVGAFSPGIVLLAGVALATVVSLASLIPSRRASQVDPMVALRSE